jgi:coenzyme F420-dependent glucose-6-phosphate dehydrogenase
MKVGFHASHEQFKPSELLKLVQLAEKSGFNTAMCSDHFHPWGKNQGECGFAWTWLGAVLNATSLPFGVVTAPGQRYHPAILAQAVATIGEMFPDRFWVAVGSGQLLNEGITGERWPGKMERNERLKESAAIMKSLWAGGTVTYRGYVNIEEATLYTRPKKIPLLIGAAISVETAEWVGGWADGIITTPKTKEELQKFIKAFHRGGGKGKPMYIKVQVSYDETEEKALKGAWDQWKTNAFKNSVQTNLRSPEQFNDASELVKPQDIHNKVHISANIEDHIKWLEEYIKHGFEHIYLHNVNRSQRKFIEDFGEHVVPVLMD